MTLNEFLQNITIEYDLDGNKILPDEYKLLLDVEIKGYKYQTRYVKEIVIDIKNKTITLKGK